MKDALGVVAVILGAICIVGAVMMLGYQFSPVQFTLLGIIVAISGIIIYLKFFHGGDQKPPKK
ncbi:hypothetical protein [Fulvivirga ligni]|uniref:hypothetical protein n=1 Tax=Fulvivirga ligni TaxID=2904246 RepID=UPI001F1F237F|nr:hypothetical protein [Fulvivirga ligni]UII21017.1 hypothetical protein LVD16_24540 [Fulvivirga ligni]